MSFDPLAAVARPNVRAPSHLACACAVRPRECQLHPWSRLATVLDVSTTLLGFVLGAILAYYF